MSGEFTPLKGVRVLDLSRVLAGPLCTQYLADLGADVIKVESPVSGDDTRGWPPLRKPGFGAVFMSLNRNKRSLAIDLKSDIGRDIVRNIALGADILVENFLTGGAERFGLGHEELSAHNPKLIYCSISGYGRSGPMKNSGGYDVILQAFSGMMSLGGEEGGGFVRIPISPIDHLTGVHAYSGVLAALLERGRTGRGRKIELSLLDTAISLLNYNFESFWQRGAEPKRYGSSHEGLCPYQAFMASDGPIMIGVANDGLWRKFCTVTDLNHLVDDNRFAVNSARVDHRETLIPLVQDALLKNTVDHWVTELTKINVPVSAIATLRQAEAHAQTINNEIILEYPFEGSESAKTVALPAMFDGARATAIRRAPPALGADSAAILKEAGFSDARIDALVSMGIVRAGA